MTTQATGHYRTPPEEVRALGLAVTGAGLVLGKTAHVTARRLPNYAGVLVTKGSGRLVFHDRPGSHEVQAGTLFWLPPGVGHSYGPVDGSWDEYWVLFDGPASERYEDLGYLGGGAAAISTTNPGRIRRIILDLTELLAEPETLGGHIAAAAAVHTLISTVGTGDTRDAGQDDLGHRALHLLTNDLANPPKIGAVARQLAVSSDTLAAAVRRITGSTPGDYLTRHRISRAKILLADTDWLIARVAREVGYPDPAYFTRVFAREVGVPPTEFRRQQHSWQRR